MKAYIAVGINGTVFQKIGPRLWRAKRSTQISCRWGVCLGRITSKVFNACSFYGLEVNKEKLKLISLRIYYKEQSVQFFQRIMPQLSRTKRSYFDSSYRGYLFKPSYPWVTSNFSLIIFHLVVFNLEKDIGFFCVGNAKEIVQ